MLYFNVDKEAFGDFVPQTPYQGSALDLAEASPDLLLCPFNHVSQLWKQIDAYACCSLCHNTQ